MEKVKRKNSEFSQRRYWRIFVPMAFILTLFVKFPLRILLWETFWDIVLYGVVSLICLLVAWRVYRRYRTVARELITIIVLCACLSGWQVFDLAVLRTNYIGIAGYGYYMAQAWYRPRFPNAHILCHSIHEQYAGNNYVAITLHILHVPWYACGG